MGISIRISLASPEADLAAVVRRGVSTIVVPRVESASQIVSVDVRIREFEKLHGIRPETVKVHALIESPTGVTMAQEIASSSSRLTAIGVGPNVTISIEGDALAYATGECELHALSAGLTPLNMQYVLD